MREDEGKEEHKPKDESEEEGRDGKEADTDGDEDEADWEGVTALKEPLESASVFKFRKRSTLFLFKTSARVGYRLRLSWGAGRGCPRGDSNFVSPTSAWDALSRAVRRKSRDPAGRAPSVPLGTKRFREPTDSSFSTFFCFLIDKEEVRFATAFLGSLIFT